MSIANTLWKNREDLVQSFHISIIHGLINTWDRCKGKPHEPDLVAGLVIESTPQIHAALESVLSSSKISVSMSAVFCHQSPMVTCSTTSPFNCELGDILFAYIHTTRNGEVRRNAILFQAKATADQPYSVKTCDKKQLTLYKKWPDFEYTSPSFLNGGKRYITPKAPHSGGQYLLIDNRPPTDSMSGLQGFSGTYPVGCCMPDDILHDHSQLASELFNMLIFQTGRPFEDRQMAAIKNDWSQVVWDILDTGLIKAFNRKNSGRKDSPRGSFGGEPLDIDRRFFVKKSSGAPCGTAIDILEKERAMFLYAGDNDDPPNYKVQTNNDDEPDVGVSVVLIETFELVD